MSETVKLIIEIPKDMFEWFKNEEIIDEYDESALKQVFKNGILLDDVKAEIDKAYEDFDVYDPSALGDFERKVDVILDNIGKGDKEC